MIASAPDIETSILTRVIAPQDGTFSPDAARALLDLRLSDEDCTRMRELAERARQGELSNDEEAWIRAYERIGSLIGLLQSKARQTLRHQVDQP